MTFKDQLGRTVNLPKTPSRIVSLVPSQSELLVDFGLRDKIVGVTHFCVHPVDLKKTTNIVGGTKKARLHKLEKVKPDFILCNKEENTREMVEEMEKIAPVWVTDMYSIADCNEMILGLGEVLQVQDKAKEIVEKIKIAQADFEGFMVDKPSRSVIYTIWRDPYMAAGRNTFIQELLQLNKMENAILDPDSRYPEIDLDDFKDIDEILLSTEPYPFKEKDAIAMRAERNQKVRVVDGEYFSWYGSRLIGAFEYFKTLH